MVSTGIANMLKAIKPHIPLIRFRKGATLDLVRGTPAPPTPPNAAAAAAPSTKAAAVVLEEWQVPAMYGRPALSQEEIDCINSGGIV